MSKCDWAGFLIFGLVFVLREFELGRRVGRQSHMGLICVRFRSLESCEL